MRNNWLFFTHLDLDSGYPYTFLTESHLSYGLGGHLWSQFGSFVDSSLYHSKQFYIPGSLAVQGAFSCISKFAGALLFWLSSGPNSNSNFLRSISGNSRRPSPRNCQSCMQVKRTITCSHNLAGFDFSSRSRDKSAAPLIFGKILNSTVGHFWRDVEHLQSIPALSLAAALVPPFNNISSNILAIPLQNTDEQIKGDMEPTLCEDVHRGCTSLSLRDISWERDAVEPRTGIKFPTILDNLLTGGYNSCLTSEVLVGIGSRSMTIVRVKSLKLYAFGFYIHPDSVCEKLGPKYASVPISELNNRQEFFEDLLREDIHMTVRLVVNCNGMKINTVRDAFEKSLRARLLKMNPSTDYHCLRVFGSHFTRDIPLPSGTTIDFRRTADGDLITEIEGKQIGAVRSKDLCRAFFDMYIGDVPVSVQAKHEIATNVAAIMRRC
eukprot:TRINITY_DN26671_c0_g1_i1.p1 TRINITY_DN26671_c0_g1~~TRINITY_DN26671_c0_g1_i1.p1  ORF type:complete len:436 (-),score=44.54 TRINITY_DN26671_c0_g1_i1:386-1693(-)